MERQAVRSLVDRQPTLVTYFVGIQTCDCPEESLTKVHVAVLE